MSALGIVATIAALVIGYEALKQFGFLKGNMSAQAAGGTGSMKGNGLNAGDSGGSGGGSGQGPSSYWIGKAAPGAPFDGATIYQRALAHGFTAQGANMAVYLANRETGNGANMGPACARSKNDPILNGFDNCQGTSINGLDPHYGIYQWSYDIWKWVWDANGGHCLGDLDCELDALYKATRGGVDWSPWAL